MQDEPLCFKVTLEAEAVTPLFLAGANPKDKPELRPPSIRGALRYWFRAAMGEVFGDGVLVCCTRWKALFSGVRIIARQSEFDFAILPANRKSQKPKFFLTSKDKVKCRGRHLPRARSSS